MTRSMRPPALPSARAPSGVPPADRVGERPDAMHIVFATNKLDVGGIEINLVRLTRELIELGHEVTVVSARGKLSGEVEAAGGVTVDVEMNLRSAPVLRRDMRAVAALLQARPADVIQVFSASSAVLISLVRRLARWRGRAFPPVVSAIMGLVSSSDEPPPRTYARAWATTFGADLLLTTSPAIDHMARRLPIARSRIREALVVGVELRDPQLDESQRRRLRDELLGERGTKLVMTAGRLEASKSHELFVAAAAEIVRREPGARMAIVGEGSLRRQLTEQIDELGLTGVVALLGERSDLDDLLRCTDVYVRPGVVDGLIGITVLEAQAACVPVVAFDTEDVRMGITHGVTGWLVAPGDVRGLADAVTRLLDPSDADREVVAAARRQVAERFDIAVVARSLAALYGELPSADGRVLSEA
jgi:glycosyltransferase involved in cell wall biosynthesis